MSLDATSRSPRPKRRLPSGMIRIDAEVRKEQGFTGRLGATTLGLDCDEHSIDLLKFHRVIDLQNPTFVCRRSLEENREIESVLAIAPPPPPNLECTNVPEARLMVQIEAIKNERSVFCVEDTGIRLLWSAVLVRIVYFGHIEL